MQTRAKKLKRNKTFVARVQHAAICVYWALMAHHRPIPTWNHFTKRLYVYTRQMISFARCCRYALMRWIPYAIESNVLSRLVAWVSVLYFFLPFCTLSFVEKGFFCILKVNGKIPSECVFVWKDVVTHWLKMNDNIRMTLNVARSLIVLYTFFEFIPSTYKRVPWAMSTHHIVCTSELNFQST